MNCDPATGHALGMLVDRFNRIKRKLRVSLTDRCNLRCIYCMPEQPTWRTKPQILTLEELSRLVALFVTELGITQIRLTGGEPLMRRGVSDFIRALEPLRGYGLERVSLSTNGTRLAREAMALAAAGLDDVNVSLDSLAPERFAVLTGGGRVGAVKAGIAATRGAGLLVKVNSVMVRGANEDEVLRLAEWSMEEGIELRFIEFMPLDARGLWSSDKVYPECEIIERLRERFAIRPLPRTREPAAHYLIDGVHRVGVIPAVSNPFCMSCDRLRLTASGEFFTCLFSSEGVDLRTPLRAGESERLAALVREAVWNKPRGFIELGVARRGAAMHVLGG